jgi:hypothetical protein
VALLELPSESLPDAPRAPAGGGVLGLDGVLTPPAAEVGAPTLSASARGAAMPIRASATTAATAHLVLVVVVISRSMSKILAKL